MTAVFEQTLKHIVTIWTGYHACITMITDRQRDILIRKQTLCQDRVLDADITFSLQVAQSAIISWPCWDGIVWGLVRSLTRNVEQINRVRESLAVIWCSVITCILPKPSHACNYSETKPMLTSAFFVLVAFNSVVGYIQLLTARNISCCQLWWVKPGSQSPPGYSARGGIDFYSVLLFILIWQGVRIVICHKMFSIMEGQPRCI